MVPDQSVCYAACGSSCLSIFQLSRALCNLWARLMYKSHLRGWLQSACKNWPTISKHEVRLAVQALNLSPALATGLILVSCCPGGQVCLPLSDYPHLLSHAEFVTQIVGHAHK